MFKNDASRAHLKLTWAQFFNKYQRIFQGFAIFLMVVVVVFNYLYLSQSQQTIIEDGQKMKYVSDQPSIVINLFDYNFSCFDLIS